MVTVKYVNFRGSVSLDQTSDNVIFISEDETVIPRIDEQVALPAQNGEAKTPIYIVKGVLTDMTKPVSQRVVFVFVELYYWI